MTRAYRAAGRRTGRRGVDTWAGHRVERAGAGTGFSTLIPLEDFDPLTGSAWKRYPVWCRPSSPEDAGPVGVGPVGVGPVGVGPVGVGAAEAQR
jgi:hypothetical protein